jgi:superfamily I DNA/RNA helicase
VIFDSAKRFKGLEAGAVILVDVPDPGEPGSEERRVLYAGITRATTYLCIIATQELIDKLKRISSERESADY